MKTERIEFVAPPGLKAKLQEEAAVVGISVGELIRQRFEPSDDEQELRRLTTELREATRAASVGLAAAVAEVDSLIAGLRSRRKNAEREAA